MDVLNDSSKTRPIFFLIILIVVTLGSLWYIRNTYSYKLQNQPLSVEGGPPSTFNPYIDVTKSEQPRYY